MYGLFICMIPNNIEVNCKIDKWHVVDVKSILVFSKKHDHCGDDH